MLHCRSAITSLFSNIVLPALQCHFASVMALFSNSTDIRQHGYFRHEIIAVYILVRKISCEYSYQPIIYFALFAYLVHVHV